MSERMQEAALAAAQLLGLVVAGVVLYQMGQPEVGSLVLGAALGHAAPRRRRGDRPSSPPPAALLAVLGVLALPGCGASAVRVHATSATIATQAASAFRAELVRARDAAIAECGTRPLEERLACLDEARETHTAAAVAFDVAVLAIADYREMVEVAHLADDQELVAVVLARGRSHAGAQWARAMELARALGARVPTGELVLASAGGAQ